MKLSSKLYLGCQALDQLCIWNFSRSSSAKIVPRVPRVPRAQSRIGTCTEEMLSSQTERAIITAIGMTPNDPRSEKQREFIFQENLAAETLGLLVGNLEAAEILVLQLKLALL